MLGTEPNRSKCTAELVTNIRRGLFVFNVSLPLKTLEDWMECADASVIRAAYLTYTSATDELCGQAVHETTLADAGVTS